MILTPDSSAQASLASSPAPESPISSVYSHGSPASGVSRVSCVSQSMPTAYHVAQMPHHLSPSMPAMPTMDSTVSSAKPEPELNIGRAEKHYFRKRWPLKDSAFRRLDPKLSRSKPSQFKVPRFEASRIGLMSLNLKIPVSPKYKNRSF